MMLKSLRNIFHKSLSHFKTGLLRCKTEVAATYEQVPNDQNKTKDSFEAVHLKLQTEHVGNYFTWRLKDGQTCSEKKKNSIYKQPLLYF